MAVNGPAVRSSIPRAAKSIAPRSQLKTAAKSCGCTVTSSSPCWAAPSIGSATNESASSAWFWVLVVTNPLRSKNLDWALAVAYSPKPQLGARSWRQLSSPHTVFTPGDLMTLPAPDARDSKPQLRKAMGFWDVLLFNIAAVLGPRWIAAAGHNGTSSVSLWVLAALLFFVPGALVINELSSRVTEEGGF